MRHTKHTSHLSAPQRRKEEQRRKDERKKAKPMQDKEIPAPKVGPMFPHITVELSGTNGNAMAIVGRVRRALDRAGVSGDVAETFVRQALSGDYDHVIQTSMRWVDIT